jgi:hypothetical protein
MKYELKVRGFINSDIRPECPYPPEPDELEMYIDSLVDDIAGIIEVKKVVRNQCNITIELKQFLEEKDLMSKIEPYFNDGRWCQYRFVSLEMINNE